MEDSLLADALAFARGSVVENQPLACVRDRNARLGQARAKPGLFDEYLKTHAFGAVLTEGSSQPAMILTYLPSPPVWGRGSEA